MSTQRRPGLPAIGDSVVFEGVVYVIENWSRHQKGSAPSELQLVLKEKPLARFAVLSNGQRIKLRDDEQDVKAGDLIMTGSRLVYGIERVEEEGA